MLLTSDSSKCTSASLCRKHHLLKTFWGWRDEQQPDGTVIWTSPRGRTFTTDPGSRLWFPTLCKPTAPVTVPRDMPAEATARTLKMPRRTKTRQQSREDRIAQLRHSTTTTSPNATDPHPCKRLRKGEPRTREKAITRVSRLRLRSLLRPCQGLGLRSSLSSRCARGPDTCPAPAPHTPRRATLHVDVRSVDLKPVLRSASRTAPPSRSLPRRSGRQRKSEWSSQHTP